MILADVGALITGGASGIGRHLVTDLARVVKAVHVVDKNAAALDELASEIPSIVPHTCDLTDNEAVEATVKATFDSECAPTVLINNAGLIHSEPLINIMSREDRRHDIETWHRTIDANLHTVFYVTRAFADEMVRRRSKGVIINISSISAGGNAGQSAYAAAKAAVSALTKTWSKELGVFGIRCAAIAPGFIDTESTSASLSDAHLKNWKKKTPLGRLGTVEEVAGAVRFIIENDFYSGQILGLDGGLTL